MRAGTAAPPNAAATGSSALRGSASSPATISRLISRPTSRKKQAMRRSLIKCPTLRWASRPPREKPMLASCQKSASPGRKGTFSMNSATSAAATMRTVARVDECVNSIRRILRR